MFLLKYKGIDKKYKMKNAYKFFFGCFLLLFFNTIHSQKRVQLTFPQLIENRFSKQSNKTLPEKVYLQTDKPYYSAGEDIWFKGYLVNAAILLPNSQSRYIYVELIDKSDSIINRVKIRRDSLGFAGCIKLKPEMPVGNYVLRAYTYWMQNVSSDFFFSKNIYIGNSIDDAVSCKIEYGIPVSNKIPVILTFTNSYKSPVVGKKFSITQNWKSLARKNVALTSNSDGKINWQIAVDSADHSNKFIDVSINNPDMKFNKRFFIPDFSSDFDVQFFPESGALLNDNLQTLAFKAIGTDGLSVEVSGKVFSDKNVEIAEFQSFNKGMGKFIIDTNAGESYYAIIKSAAGVEKRFKLPSSQSEGLAIHLVFNKSKILYEIKNQTNKPNEAFYLLVHSRGIVYVIQPLKKLEGQIAESLLPPGIASFSIIDSLGNTYCERLSFVRNFNFPIINMQNDRRVYSKRELVNLNLNIQSLRGKSVAGNYSISITDSKTVKLDSLSNNIKSYLLLSSDIKGYVEDPAAYLADDKIETREKTDVLMLTQAWRRFNTADVVKNSKVQTDFYLEAGQTLSGKILNLLGKPSKKCDIIMLSPYKSMIKTTQTDSTGTYLIDGIEFPDSTTFVLKARKKKTFGDVEIIPDADVFPKPNVFIPTSTAKTTIPPIEYFQQTKEKYYTEGGMRIVNLSEVTVTADRKTTDESSDIYSGMADTQITSESLEKYPAMSILDVLRTVAGIQVMGDRVSIRGSQNNPMFLIDGIETEDIEDLTYMTATDVENISVFKGADASIFGSRGGNGVITITLKKGVIQKVGVPISLAQIMPLGYQKPTQFYEPKYDVDSIKMSEKPDLRTTIYWNPMLITDNTGNIHVKFYTADKANNYSVVFEGITNTGEICRYVGILKREEK